METDGESQATAQILAGADMHSASANGYGAETTASTMPSPAIIVCAALVGGFLLARVVRRIRG